MSGQGRRCQLGAECGCEAAAVVAVQDRTGVQEWGCERHAARALDVIAGARIGAVVDWPACERLLALPWNRRRESR